MTHDTALPVPSVSPPSQAEQTSTAPVSTPIYAREVQAGELIAPGPNLRKKIYDLWLISCHFSGEADELEATITQRRRTVQRDRFGMKVICALVVAIVIFGAVVGFVVGLMRNPGATEPLGGLFGILEPTLLGLMASVFGVALFCAAVVGIYRQWWEEVPTLEREISELEDARQQKLDAAEDYLARAKALELTYAQRQIRREIITNAGAPGQFLVTD